MKHDTTVPAVLKRFAAQLREARAANPLPPLLRIMDETRHWATGEAQQSTPMPESTPALKSTRARKRRLDFVKQVKRAMAAGLNVKSASVTADSVLMTFGETEAPALIDEAVIETADELRKLI
jgi:hypothetical protein